MILPFGVKITVVVKGKLHRNEKVCEIFGIVWTQLTQFVESGDFGPNIPQHTG